MAQRLDQTAEKANEFLFVNGRAATVASTSFSAA